MADGAAQAGWAGCRRFPAVRRGEGRRRCSPCLRRSRRKDFHVTISLLGRCVRTGQFGAAVTTSSIAVGSRVPFVAPGVGGVLTQHRTAPRLGPRGLALLRTGCTAAETVAALVSSTPQHAWRQLAVLDAKGGTAHFHGGHVKPALGAA